MSDGPTKLVPGGPLHDESVVGDRESSPDVKDPRKRGRMTLRIPDDEITRPKVSAEPSVVPSAPVLAGASPSGRIDPPRPEESSPVPSSPVPLQPSRIIAIGPGPAPVTMSATTTRNGSEGVAERRSDTSKRPPALGIDDRQDMGWTPFQPGVAPLPPIAPAPSGPISVEIPIDFPEGELPDTVQTKKIHPYESSEDIRIDESDRATDPNALPAPVSLEEAEVSAEDLVSVDSTPSPHPLPIQPVAVPVSAAALMAGATAPAPNPRPLPSQPEASLHVEPTIEAPSAPKVPVAPVSPIASVAPPPKTPSNPPVVPARSSPSLEASAVAPSIGALSPPPMSEAAAHRKKGKPWWEDLFNDDFIRTQSKVTDGDIAREVNFIEESLACEEGATLLDLACGTGRHAVELAKRGYQVVGFDLSLAMLARASDEAQDRRQKINFVQGDMREMQFEDTFDGIYSWNTSFGFFDEEKNNAVIARVHRALKKGGQFLLDVANRDYIVRQAPSLAWFEGDGCICMDEMQIDFITSRMRVKRTLMMDDGRSKEIEYSIRLYSLHELGKLLHDNGFRVAEVSGRMGTPGVFFGCESPRTLILAEKR